MMRNVNQGFHIVLNEGIHMKIFNKFGEILVESTKKSINLNGLKYRVFNCNLDNHEIVTCTIKDGYFELGSMEKTSFRNCKLIDVIFEGAWLTEVQFLNSFLRFCEFYASQAYKSRFYCVILEDVKFLGTNLSQSEFINSVFKNVIFGADNIGHKTNLEGVDFSSCTFENVVLQGVDYDSITKFPIGFSPPNGANKARIGADYEEDREGRAGRTGGDRCRLIYYNHAYRK